MAEPNYEAFAKAILDTFPEGAPGEFGIQELAIKFGLLIETKPDKPCGEDCWCLEYYGEEEFAQGGVTCCRKAWAQEDVK